MAAKVFKLPRSLKQRAREEKRSRWDDDGTDRAYFSYEDDIVGSIIDGLPIRVPKKPDIAPEMPDDITQLTDPDVGKLRSQYVAMCEWLDWQVAVASLNAGKADAYLKHIWAVVHLQKSGTVEDKKSKTFRDDRYGKEEVLAFKANATAKLFRARLEGYERCANDLSREQTRREKEMERDIRNR